MIDVAVPMIELRPCFFVDFDPTKKSCCAAKNGVMVMTQKRADTPLTNKAVMAIGLKDSLMKLEPREMQTKAEMCGT